MSGLVPKTILEEGVISVSKSLPKNSEALNNPSFHICKLRFHQPPPVCWDKSFVLFRLVPVYKQILVDIMAYCKSREEPNRNNKKASIQELRAELENMRQERDKWKDSCQELEWSVYSLKKVSESKDHQLQNLSNKIDKLRQYEHHLKKQLQAKDVYTSQLKQKNDELHKENAELRLFQSIRSRKLGLS